MTNPVPKNPKDVKAMKSKPINPRAQVQRPRTIMPGEHTMTGAPPSFMKRHQVKLFLVGTFATYLTGAWWFESPVFKRNVSDPVKKYFK